MTDDEIERLIKLSILMTGYAAILMTDYISKYITETEDEKDLNELMERLQKLLREGSNDELR